MNVPHPLTTKSVYTIPPLISLVLLLVFFAFFGISNILPRSKYFWDSQVTLLRKDLLISSNSIDIIFRWFKSRQSRSTISRVQVPRLPGHPLCPVSAVEKFIKAPVAPTSPCFSYLHHGHLVSLTQVQVRLILKQFGHQLNLPYDQICRSGVSFLYSLWLNSNDMALGHLFMPSIHIYSYLFISY